LPTSGLILVTGVGGDEAQPVKSTSKTATAADRLSERRGNQEAREVVTPGLGMTIV